MMLTMDDTQVNTLEQVRKILSNPREIKFRGADRGQRYAWIETVLKRFRYLTLPRRDKGQLKAYLLRLSGLSRAQLTRLVAQFLREGRIRTSKPRRNRFPAKYTATDKELLAETDNAHARLSGPATKRIFQRQCDLFGDKRFARLKYISVAHIYRLRGSRAYQLHAKTFSKTRSVRIPIGVRRKPNPQGRPGYIRVDTVHQGDLNGVKGVYHVNMVDEVTQWEVVTCVEAISEAHLEPALEAALALFPFAVLNFHSDNGGEFINGTVARLLNKLLAEQTKSRSSRTNDNALVEGKNGSVIRKHMGYSHIERRHAASIDRFYREHFILYLNFHRPCAFATVTIDEKGRRRKKYETYQTPYERLKSIKAAALLLRGGLTLQALDAIASRQSDNQAAATMQKARDDLFKAIATARGRTATATATPARTSSPSHKAAFRIIRTNDNQRQGDGS
jgi:transposase InsO family protein